MIAAIPSVKSAGPEGLAGFAENALKTLEKQELKLTVLQFARIAPMKTAAVENQNQN